MFTVTSYVYIEASQHNTDDDDDDNVVDDDKDDVGNNSNKGKEGGSICFLRKTTPKVSRNKITIPSSSLVAS